jgi:hypothetical protein
MRFAIPLIVIFMIILSPTIYGKGNQEKANKKSASHVGLLVSTSLFLDANIEEAFLYFDENARMANRGDGSVQDLFTVDRDKHAEIVEKLTLNKISFFTDTEVKELSEEYPDGMWVRMPTYLDQNVGCLVVLDNNDLEHRLILIALVISKVDDEFKVIRVIKN